MGFMMGKELDSFLVLIHFTLKKNPKILGKGNILKENSVRTLQQFST